jgi:hypothetical protein
MKRTLAVMLGAWVAFAGVAACDSSSDNAPHENPPGNDAGGGGGNDSGGGGGNDSGGGGNDGGGGGDAMPPDCYMNPKTHLEIINACTDAQAFDKNPKLPLLLPDGGLPPLP